MTNIYLRGTLTVALALLCLARPTLAELAAPAADPREWNFKVYLNDSEIGYHSFQLTEAEGRKHLVTKADFKVKFLFLTAYKYTHVSRETWRENCLQRIDAETDLNGKTIAVRGLQEAGRFELEAADAKDQPGNCVKTFAYWNPEFLQENILLNSQSGEFVPVQVEFSGDELLTVRGASVPARRYSLTAKDTALDLWYSDDGRWLGLESTLKNGRTLRYELV